MVFTTEDKARIKNLYLLKGYGAHRLFAKFPTKNWTLGGLDYLLKKLRQAGTTDRKNIQSEHSVAIELLKLNIFNWANVQAPL